jgi:hypothetical protein
VAPAGRNRRSGNFTTYLIQLGERKKKVGGRDRVRTGDPLLAKIGRTKNHRQNEAGKIILEQEVPTTREAMKPTFGKIPRSLIAMETATHSP